VHGAQELVVVLVDGEIRPPLEAALVDGEVLALLAEPLVVPVHGDQVATTPGVRIPLEMLDGEALRNKLMGGTSRDMYTHNDIAICIYKNEYAK